MRTDSVRMLEFAQHGDERGHLVVVEGMKDIPFEIKRVFYIYGSDADVVRGCHANRRSEFVLINVAGQSKVRVRDLIEQLKAGGTTMLGIFHDLEFMEGVCDREYNMQAGGFVTE